MATAPAGMNRAEVIWHFLDAFLRLDCCHAGCEAAVLTAQQWVSVNADNVGGAEGCCSNTCSVGLPWPERKPAA